MSVVYLLAPCFEAALTQLRRGAFAGDETVANELVGPSECWGGGARRAARPYLRKKKRFDPGRRFASAREMNGMSLIAKRPPEFARQRFVRFVRIMQATYVPPELRLN